ncbi:acyltransferase family protein [Sphingomonas sp. 1P08PE]|uniref:acyltransferase family protein n=1 Tax=Sphingomonas sp. 1P08PE TaxID=554122 RepID=UPI0039A24E31
MKRLDEMRGLACLGVVTFHAVSSEPSLRASSIAAGIQLLSYVRMPLFIAITGIIYGRKRQTQSLGWNGWVKRTARLLPPFLLLTLVCCGIDLAGGHGFPLASAILFGTWHLWYLQALAVVLLIVYAIERAWHPGSRGLWGAAIVAGGISASGLLAPVHLLSFDRGVDLLPHFLFGVVIGQAGSASLAPPVRRAIYVAGSAGLLAAAVGIASGTPWSSASLIGIAIGWAAILGLYRHMPAAPSFARLGCFSLPVFLWHLPVAAVLSGVLLNPLAIEPYTAVMLRIAFGIALPMVGVLVAERLAPRIIPIVGRRSRPDASPPRRWLYPQHEQASAEPALADQNSSSGGPSGSRRSSGGGPRSRSRRGPTAIDPSSF